MCSVPSLGVIITVTREAFGQIEYFANASGFQDSHRSSVVFSPLTELPPGRQCLFSPEKVLENLLNIATLAL